MTYDQFMEDKRGERPQIGVAGEACYCTVRQSRPTASSNPRNQACDLQVRVDPGGLAQLHMLPRLALQTGPFG